jgi:Mg-chelatase subunit ChlD
MIRKSTRLSTLGTAGIFLCTAIGIVAYARNQPPPIEQTPPPPVAIQLPTQLSERPLMQVVFALDTTGSMSGLIETAKEKIWSIASSMAQAQPAPEIQLGLVAYRDRGDTYVTQVHDLSGDLDSVYARLMDFEAGGGGDGPESVNQALHEAVTKISWSERDDVYKVVFLVGDAEGHMDYQDDVKFPDSVKLAQHKKIQINTIQCGADRSASAQWQQIAMLSQGKYFQVEQGGGALAMATPYDAKLAELARRMDDTRMYYGSAEEKDKARSKLAAISKLNASASEAALARRADFNLSASGKANLGDNELIDDIASGTKSLADIAPEMLPEPLAAAPAAERERIVQEKVAARQQLKQQIRELSEERSQYVAKELETTDADETSLDKQIYSVIQEQAGKVGLSYKEDGVKY